MRTMVIVLAAFGVFFGNLSCTGKSGALEKAGEWQIPPVNGIAEFYYLKQDLPEPQMKAEALKRARQLVKKYSAVAIYIFYDRAFAQKSASPGVRDRVMQGRKVMGPEVFKDPELRIQGGGLLQMFKGEAEGKWFYQARAGN